jgi:hypothetical protein
MVAHAPQGGRKDCPLEAPYEFAEGVTVALLRGEHQFGDARLFKVLWFEFGF